MNLFGFKIYKIYLIVFLLFFTSFLTFAKKNKVVMRPPQFILLSFDGSKSIDFWEETRNFAKEQGIKFTYFISGTMFLTHGDRKLYEPPRHPVGSSSIGFGGKAAIIKQRIEQVVLAIKEGNEIGSHANGHYTGHKWSYKEWLSEFKQFNKLMKKSLEKYGVGTKKSKFVHNYLDNHIKGFKAPFLAHNKEMLQVMGKMGFTYDASKINIKDYWPRKIQGIWDFPIVKLRLAHSKKPTLSMDYDHYKAHSKAKEIGYYSEKFEKDVVETYLQYFNHNYYGSRAPLNIGHHFSQWNKGVYWKAMKKFASIVCHKPEVRCTTYSKLVDFLEKSSDFVLKSYREKKFDTISHKLTAH